MALAAATVVVALALGSAVPSGAAPEDDEVFVVEAYDLLVGREVDDGGLAYWTGRLEAGTSRATVATALALSGEALREQWVDETYEQWRSPADPAGKAYWVDRISRGGRMVDLEVAVLSSRPGTDADYVADLYRELLDRRAGEGELAYWAGRLAAGTTHGRVAALILGSSEVEGLRVDEACDRIAPVTLTAEQRTAGMALLDRTRDVRRLAAFALVSLFRDAPAPVNQVPTAVIGTTTTSGGAPLTVGFDGSSSTDPDGTIVSHAYDFGDGGVANEAQASHTYTAPGTYTAVLTVTDDGGAVATAQVTITVTAPNQAPTAIITPGAPSGPAPFTVTLDGTSSTDPDGTIASYQWNTAVGSLLGTGPTVTFTVDAPGSHRIYLTVMDDDGTFSGTSTVVTAT